MMRGAHLRKLSDADYVLIIRLRKAGLSQDKVGEIVGCTAMQVSRVERGRVKCARGALEGDTAPDAQR